ncbi:hypothetical protein LPJ75_005620, partial [Coemansia sp. RSA 2598]
MASKENDATGGTGFDECDRLSELHGASAAKSPAIISPALTDGSGGNPGGSGSQKAGDRQEDETLCFEQQEDEEQRRQQRETECKEAAEAAGHGDSQAVAEKEQSETAPEEITLKQLYGMLCWLQVGDNRKRWMERPLDACVQATSECPHLINADPRKLTAKLDALNMARLRMIDSYGGAGSVPQDVRMFEGGPLFVLFHHAVSAAPEASSDAQTQSQIMANATGLRQPVAEQQQQQQQQHQPAGGGVATAGPGSFRSVLENPAFGGLGGGGPTRHHRRAAGPTVPSEHPFMQRARRLTPAEIRQMRDELAIRREIGIRDAALLADWIALRRRELELKEAQIREI